MADKLHSDTQERIETLSYTCPLQDSGDLEAGTNTITATSEASGIGSADYNDSLTLPKPDDARLTVKRIVSRFQVTIDSMTAGHLYCRVYVDQQDAEHRLFDEDWTADGEKLGVVDTHSGNKAAVYNLLKDGLAHTFYFFFWVDSGNAVISIVELWEGVGQGGTSYNQNSLEIDHVGLISIGCPVNKVGTGSVSARIGPSASVGSYIADASGTTAHLGVEVALVNNHAIAIKSTVATDLVYLSSIFVTLMRQL